jgi:hypothetical protein
MTYAGGSGTGRTARGTEPASATAACASGRRAGLLWRSFVFRCDISLTLNSPDDPESVAPGMRFSADRAVSWRGSLATLPTKQMDVTGSPDVVNYQYQTR